MKKSVLPLILIALFCSGCGSSKGNDQNGQGTSGQNGQTSLAGQWSITVTEQGYPDAQYAVDLVANSNPLYDFCNYGLPVIYSDCFVANASPDPQVNEGSLNCVNCSNLTPQFMFLGASSAQAASNQSLDINGYFNEYINAGGGTAIARFTGTVLNGTITGTWMLENNSGLAGKFNGTQ